MSDDSVLLLETVSHTYMLDAHTIVPGVTECLQQIVDLFRLNMRDIEGALECLRRLDEPLTVTGDDIAFVRNYLRRLVGISNARIQDVEYASDRGTSVHRATALFDRNELDESSVDGVIETRFAAYRKFRSVTGFEPYEIEKTCYHDLYGYATTLDRAGWLFGHLAILELKATSQHSAVTGVQTSAQFEAFNHERKRLKLPLATKRYSVRLLANGEFDLREYKNKRDWRTFLACLTLHTWRLDNDKELKKLSFTNIIDPIFVGDSANSRNPTERVNTLQ